MNLTKSINAGLITCHSMRKTPVLLLCLLMLTVSLAGCTEEINEQVTVSEGGTCFAILEINGTMVSNGTYEGYDENHATLDTYTYNSACLVASHLSTEGNYSTLWTNTTYDDEGNPLVMNLESGPDSLERIEYVYENGLLMTVKTTEDVGEENEMAYYVNYTYDDQGRELTRYVQDWDQYTNTTYGSNGEIIQEVQSGPWGTTISNMTYDAQGNQIQIEYASQYRDADWSYTYDNYTYENGKLVQHVDDNGGPDYTYYTNYTYSTDGLTTEAWRSSGGVTITTFDADGNTLSEVMKSSQYEDGTWQYVFTRTYTWGDPLAEA